MITDVKDSIESVYNGLICDFEELIKWPNETDVQRRANDAQKKLKETVIGYPRLMIDAFLLQMLGELLIGSHKQQTKDGRLKVLAIFTELLAANATKANR